MRKLDALLMASLAVALMSAQAPAFAQTRHAAGVEKAPRLKRAPPPRVIVLWRPAPKAYRVDRRLREQMIFSPGRSMDGFGCRYNPITGMDDLCAPR